MDTQTNHKLQTLIDVDTLQAMIDNDEVTLLYTHMEFPVNNTGIVKSKCCIPNSTFFDFEKVFTDSSSSVPHMLPSAESFSQNMSLLGLNNEDVLVVYDNQGLFSAPRVWWMLKSMGHKQVYILNGGLKAWLDAGKASVPLSNLQSNTALKTQYNAKLQIDRVANKQMILEAINRNDVLICDARGAKRFDGSEPEPRVGIRSGHMPSAVNLHYAKLIENGFLKELPEIQQYFTQLNNQATTQWLFTCGSGVTACILALAAHELGVNHWAVYDGSWSEWGADPDLPIICVNE